MTYEDHIYKLLINMKPGKAIVLSEICINKPIERFIEVVKEFIDIHPVGVDIYLSNDYTKVHKMEVMNCINKHQGLPP